MHIIGQSLNENHSSFGEGAQTMIAIPTKNKYPIPAPLQPRSGESVLSVQELARQFNVSTKTINRWRRQGLVSRRFVLDGRRRIGFLQSSVAKFVCHNRRRVEFGSRFTRMTQEERETVFDQARRLATAGARPSEVTHQLAHQTGRSLETIRCMLRRFDREHPQMAIFPDHHGPARPETKQEIYRGYRQGESVAALAQRYSLPLTGIRHIILELQAQQIMSLPLAYIPNAEFEHICTTRQERILLEAMPPNQSATKPRKIPGNLPPYLASLYQTPLLTHEQEVFLFRKMNYLKYNADLLRSQLNPAKPQSGLMDRIERLYDLSLTAKNQIITANLRLVVSIAKRHFSPETDLFALISDGNMSLIRAVDKYDFARGFKFSTYASWAIMKNFSRTIPGEYRHQDRFRVGLGEVFESAEDVRTDQHELEDTQSRQEGVVAQILQHLDAREREIITRRFGLVHGQEPLTLKQVGKLVGVTKERVRQIEVRAMDKLRAAAIEEGLGELALT